MIRPIADNSKYPRSRHTNVNIFQLKPTEPRPTYSLQFSSQVPTSWHRLKGVVTHPSIYSVGCILYSAFPIGGWWCHLIFVCCRNSKPSNFSVDASEVSVGSAAIISSVFSISSFFSWWLSSALSSPTLFVLSSVTMAPPLSLGGSILLLNLPHRWLSSPHHQFIYIPSWDAMPTTSHVHSPLHPFPVGRYDLHLSTTLLSLRSPVGRYDPLVSTFPR